MSTDAARIVELEQALTDLAAAVEHEARTFMPATYTHPMSLNVRDALDDAAAVLARTQARSVCADWPREIGRL